MTAAASSFNHYETMRVILGGARVIRRPIENELDLVVLSREGITKASVVSVSQFLGVSMERMSDLLHTSHRTIQRKRDDESLGIYASEQTIEVAEVLSKGLDLFGTRERLTAWLNTPLWALGGKTPLSLLDTSYGTKLILKELGRLEHGIFS
jgi:putative toxin-antitoxin system antitoxin component (TIGR02293 family)